MIFGSIVAQKDRGIIQHADNNVDLTIVIQIAEGSPTRHDWQIKSRAGGRRYIRKSLPEVAHQEWRLLVLQIARGFFDSIEDVALRHKNVTQAIIICIDKMRAPARVRKDRKSTRLNSSHLG